jgi:hypothetical protein
MVCCCTPIRCNYFRHNCTSLTLLYDTVQFSFCQPFSLFGRAQVFACQKGFRGHRFSTDCSRLSPLSRRKIAIVPVRKLYRVNLVLGTELYTSPTLLFCRTMSSPAYPVLSCTLMHCLVLPCNGLPCMSCSVLHSHALSSTVLFSTEMGCFAYPVLPGTLIHCPPLSCSVLQ